jgi:hypothetical protein
MVFGKRTNAATLMILNAFVVVVVVVVAIEFL